MDPGDALVHTRYLFHKSDDFTAEGKAAYEAAGTEAKPLLRYTVRYMPTTARISPQSTFEASVQSDPSLAGMPLSAAPEHYPVVLRRNRGGEGGGL